MSTFDDDARAAIASKLAELDVLRMELFQAHDAAVLRTVREHEDYWLGYAAGLEAAVVIVNERHDRLDPPEPTPDPWAGIDDPPFT